MRVWFVAVLIALTSSPSAHAAVKLNLDGGVFFGPRTETRLPPNPIVYVSALGPAESARIRASGPRGETIPITIEPDRTTDPIGALWKVRIHRDEPGPVRLTAKWRHRDQNRIAEASYVIDRGWRPSRLVPRDRSWIHRSPGLTHNSVFIRFAARTSPAATYYQVLEGTTCEPAEASVTLSSQFYGVTPTSQLRVVPVWPDGTAGPAWTGRPSDVALDSTWSEDHFDGAGLVERNCVYGPSAP